jgi:hypothetical protein
VSFSKYVLWMDERGMGGQWEGAHLVLMLVGGKSETV